MPLIIITGVPSSGKTSRANELKDFFVSKGKKVHIISESEHLIRANFEKNVFYSGVYSKKKKIIIMS